MGQDGALTTIAAREKVETRVFVARRETGVDSTSMREGLKRE